jgi:hypothetical protein
MFAPQAAQYLAPFSHFSPQSGHSTGCSVNYQFDEKQGEQHAEDEPGKWIQR